jgi:hypothetical protein
MYPFVKMEGYWPADDVIEYRVFFDGKVLASFYSYQAAQEFQNKLGKRGSVIIPKNVGRPT